MQNTFPILFSHKKIYDGLEDDYYAFQIEVELGDDLIISNVPDYKNVFKLNEIVPDSFEEIIKLMHGEKIGQFNSYKGIDDLSLVYALQPSANFNQIYLIILTKGEYQPGRYMIFLEGIWKWPIE